MHPLHGFVPALALAIAWWIDARFGEPPARLHPVVWMGAYLTRAGRGLTRLPPKRAFCLGALAWLMGALLVVAMACGIEYAIVRMLAHCNETARVVVHAVLLGVLLKPMFAWRLLRDEARAVEHALTTQGLAAGRARVARVVSRDVSSLQACDVREAAIETVAENLNDSWVAPICWFVLGGLPGAALYRYANTADAMWGMRGPWEWAGKCAARIDDVLSWGSARWSAWLLWPRRSSWPRVRHEARNTVSPNGGWPIAAIALRLGVRLGKPGVYVVNAAGREVDSSDIEAAIVLAQRAAHACGAAALVMTALIGRLS